MSHYIGGVEIIFLSIFQLSYSSLVRIDGFYQLMHGKEKYCLGTGRIFLFLLDAVIGMHIERFDHPEVSLEM